MSGGRNCYPKRDVLTIPMYVRGSLAMANYDQKEYLRKIISDALQGRYKSQNIL